MKAEIKQAISSFERKNLTATGLFGPDEKFKNISAFLGQFYATDRKETVELDERMEQVECMLLSLQKQVRDGKSSNADHLLKFDNHYYEQKIQADLTEKSLNNAQLKLTQDLETLDQKHKVSLEQ